MFVGRRKHQQQTLELQILNRLDQLDERINSIQRPPAASGILPGILSAGSSVNGTITVGDVLVSGAIFVVGAGAGAVAAPVLYAAGVPWNDATITLRIGTYGGLGLCWLKLAIDGLLYDVFNSWRNRPEEEKPSPPSKPAARPLPLYYEDHQPPPEPQLYELPNGKEIAWSDLTNYLRTATSLYDTWGTKSWAREAWVGQGHPDYPQLGQLLHSVWRGIRQLCNEWAVQFSDFADDNNLSLVWQTNDRILIEQFIEMLKDDE